MGNDEEAATGADRTLIVSHELQVGAHDRTVAAAGVGVLDAARQPGREGGKPIRRRYGHVIGSECRFGHGELQWVGVTAATTRDRTGHTAHLRDPGAAPGRRVPVAAGDPDSGVDRVSSRAQRRRGDPAGREAAWSTDPVPALPSVTVRGRPKIPANRNSGRARVSNTAGVSR